MTMRHARRKPIFVKRRSSRVSRLLAAGVAIVGIGAGAVIGLRTVGDGAVAGPGPVHVHALGLDPEDSSLFIATHTGLFRLPPGESRAERVGSRHQDTMGFTVLGPDHFLGSGHPDLRDDLPPLLGLIESRDAGKTWTPISLQGKADFHALRARGRLVVGYDATSGRVLVSNDRGATWRSTMPPEPLVDLAVDPTSAERLLAAGAGSLYLSEDGGTTWQPRNPRIGLLAWPQPRRLYLLDGSGALWLSRDSGQTWRVRGRIGGRPAALLATNWRMLFAATHEGVIVASRNSGVTWTTRSSP